MRTKNVAMIIVAIIIICAIISAIYFLMPQEKEYQNITMNGISMEVPKTNTTVQNQTDFYNIYNDSENNITIYTLDIEGQGLNALSEAIEFAAYREAYQVGASSVSKDNVSYNYSETTGIYSFEGNYSNKNILVKTVDEEDMIHILETLKVDLTTQNNSTNNTNNTTTNTTKKSTNKTSSSGTGGTYSDDISSPNTASSSLETQDYYTTGNDYYKGSDGNYYYTTYKNGKVVDSGRAYKTSSGQVVKEY